MYKFADRRLQMMRHSALNAEQNRSPCQAVRLVQADFPKLSKNSESYCADLHYSCCGDDSGADFRAYLAAIARRTLSKTISMPLKNAMLGG